jgi:protein FRA10AC1
VDLAQVSNGGQIGMRWRTEKEVICGKGDTVCGNKRCHNVAVHSFEVPFSYVEMGLQKIELVKVRLCAECSLIMDANDSPNNSFDGIEETVDSVSRGTKRKGSNGVDSERGEGSNNENKKR